MANKTKIRASLLNVEREHQTTATLVLDGEEHEVTLLFRGRSAGQGRILREKRDANGEYVDADFVGTYLISIPELVGEDEQPFAITQEYVDTWDTANVAAVAKAMNDVYQSSSPNYPPSKD